MFSGFKLIFSFLIILLASNILGFEIVREGKATAKIIVPEKACDSVKRAALELQEHIKLATGATLDIVQEHESLKGNLIFLGNCRAALNLRLNGNRMLMNECHMKVVNDRMFILGKDDKGSWLDGRISVGTLFGVYSFLNDYLNIRWLWPGELGTEISVTDNITVPNISRQIKLPLKNSRWRVSGLNNGWSSKKNRNNFLQAQAIWLRRQRFGAYSNLEYGHAFTNYWDRFHKSNPNFFNLLPNDKRISDPFYFNGRKDLISMCVSNPEFIKQIIENWHATRTVEQPYINANENDTAGKCVCENCLKWDKSNVPNSKRLTEAKKLFDKHDKSWYHALGSVSNRYARFYMELLRLADEIQPNAKAKVCGLIYANYHEPPVGIRFNNRVILRFCPPIMFPWTKEKIDQYKWLWNGWSNCEAQLIIRPNYTWDGHCFPIFYAKKFAECFKFAAKRNMIGADFDALKGSFAANGPSLYMVARLQRDFDVSADQVLQDYYNAFGPAKNDIEKYFNYLEKISDSVNFSNSGDGVEGGNFAEFYIIANRIFTSDVLANCNRMLEKALKSAKGNKIASKRVEFLKLGLKHSELVIDCQKAFLQYKNQGDAIAFAEALKCLTDFRAENEQTFFANIGPLEHFECRKWPKKMMQFIGQDMSELPKEWKFNWDKNKQGDAQKWFDITFDDSNWQTIEIGKFWDDQNAGKEWHKKHGSSFEGAAWYRLKYKLPEKSQNKNLQLVFGGVDEACTVWINGKKLLDRPYPYKGDIDSWRSAFEIDITDVVKTDSENIIVVKVINNSGKGGIWEKVYLKMSEKGINSGANLVKNSSFEKNIGAWKTQVPLGNLEFSMDNGINYSGKYSGKIAFTSHHKSQKYAGKYGTWGRYFQKVNGLIPGKNYEFKVKFRTSEDFDGEVMIWIRSGNQRGLNKANINLNWFGTKGKWQSLSTKFVPEIDNATIFLNIATNKGSAWFDDVVIYSLSGK